MATVQTIVFECDSCGAEGSSDEIKTVTVKSAHSPGRGRTFDVCGRCFKPVQKLLDQVKAPRKIPA